MKALITGSDGLIGRHMDAALTRRGWSVTGVDIKHGQDARHFFHWNDHHYDLVVHCAAHVGGREDIEGRSAYIAAVNLQLDGAMFEWALRTKPARIIYWSSSAAYPVNMQTDDGWVGGLQERDVCLAEPEPPDSSYGAVKIIGERTAEWATDEGLKVHVFRPFSGWADDQDTTYPMGAFLARARDRADPFDVWGDGTQVRDFIHADDVVAAALAAVDQDHPGPLNLCTGVGTSFNELAAMVCDAAGYHPETHPEIRHRLDKPVGVHYRVGDPTEMLKVYTPKISLAAGITAAFRS